MRKILIPTDFSENAMNATRYALELFKYDVSEFYFIHAYEDDIYNDINSTTNKIAFEDLKKAKGKASLNQLKDTLKQVKEFSPNPRHTHFSISACSSLIDETDKLVEEKNIDIIVMGTKGKADDKTLTFGSNTLQVLRYVSCPVLSIPRDFKYKRPKHILFPTNYLIPYKRRELKLLHELACPYRAKIELLYFSKSSTLSLRQQDNKQFIEETICKNELIFTMVNAKDIFGNINSQIKKKNIDMLVMVNTKHSHLEKILFESTIDKISLNIPIPFLALQNIKRD